mgnify:CR=1 FL=1
MRRYLIPSFGIAGIADITQVAAVCGQSSFSMYVKPETPITARASKVTGLTYDGISMFCQGKPVVCYSLHHVLKSFREWLTSFKDPVLFAHNCRKFDSLVLCNAMNKVLDVKLHECFSGFCDTLDFLRVILPNQEKFSLEYLVSHILKISYSAHDALEDSKVLQRLTEFPEHVVDVHYLNHTFDVSSTCDILSLQIQVKQCYETLRPLLLHNTISENMAKKIAQSGLSFLHLQLAFTRNPQDGIRNLFTEFANGHVRITNRKTIISSVSSFFKER